MKKKITRYVLAGVLFAGIAAWWAISRGAEKNIATVAAPPNGATAMANTAGMKADSIDVLAERLRARLEKEPGDVDGWVLLARSYHYLQRWDDAKAAFAKAKSLGYRGEADSNIGDGAATPPPSAAPDPIFEAVARVQDRAAQLQAPAAQVDNAAADNSVQVHLSADPALPAEAGIDSTVFIFARAAQGPRTPLAAVRKTLRDLPLDIRLDDSLAMLPNNKLSDAAAIVIGARISRSGNAAAQPGDIEVLSAPLSDWRGQHVQLLLSRKR